MSHHCLTDALVALPPPPCEKFNCRHYQKCARDELACTAFYRYVQSGYAIEPSEPPSKRSYSVAMRSEDHPQTRGARNV